jgi:hypothetical protein
LRHEIESIGKHGVQAMDELLDYLTVSNGRSGNPSLPGGGSGNAGAERDYRPGLCNGSSH